MQKERWIVEEITNSTTGESEELRGFASPDAARKFAEKRRGVTGRATSITWLLEEVNRNGREILDSEVVG